jgi:N-methylhydantoinase A
VYSVGIDMGGTFTDAYVTDGLHATVCKVPTTHFDLSRSVIGCLRRGAEWFEVEFEKFLGDVDVLRVATTIGTNAVVEGKGDTIGLIVERGTERTLYGVAESSPAVETFVAGDHVRGVDVDGDVEDVLRHCRELVAFGVRRVVVSFRRGHHRAEERVRDAVAARYPEHYLRSIPLSIGSEISAIDNDEVRTNTAVLNAYVSHPMAKLLYRTEGLLQQEGLRVPLLAVRSDASCGRVARTTAIATYGSGPAGGLAFVARLAQQYGDAIAVGFDMGGTTLDLGFVRDGAYRVDPTPAIRGVRVALPIPGVVSVGLGGSSIARPIADETAIGPDSAGAIPGPACFARGGSAPTLTDADLVLGFLGTGDRFGDEIELDDGPARTALASTFGAPPEAVARAVRDAAHRQAAAALASLLADVGVDSGSACLYAFGGAGALHAGEVAERLGITRIRSFPFGAVFSARGVAGANLRQIVETRVDGEVGDAVERLTRRASIDLDAELIDRGAAELTVEVDGEGETAIRRARLSTVVSAPRTPPIDVTGPAMATVRDVWWGTEPTPTPVFGPAVFETGDPVTGPALILLAGVVHAVPPGWTCTLDEASNLLWERP